MKIRNWLFLTLLSLTASPLFGEDAVPERYRIPVGLDSIRVGRYWVVSWPTPNIDTTKQNEVKGVVLHHTATVSLGQALYILRSPEKGVSCHVVIDRDGTRYVLAEPTAVTWHAGRSLFHGREHCNDFMLGIEFQGNTLEAPLTEDQIQSAIDYIQPLMWKYGFQKSDIVTHAMVRNAWRTAFPEKVKSEHVYGKPDITPTEYNRFMQAMGRVLP